MQFSVFLCLSQARINWEGCGRKVRYGDGAGNTDEENSSIFSLIQMC